MNNSNTKKSHKRLLIVLLLVAITTGGVFMFSLLGKSQEERRNREYEVSLVNALKNSYEGIEEIKISNPEYAERKGYKIVTPSPKNRGETNTIISDGQ